MTNAYDKLFISPEEAARRKASAPKIKHVRCICDRCRNAKAAVREIQAALSNSLRRERRLESAMRRILGEVRFSGILVDQPQEGKHAD